MPVTIKASTAAIQEAKTQGDAENIDFDGYHIFKLIKVTQTKSKAGNDQLECQYKLVGLTRQGKKVDKNYWPLRDYVQLDGETTEWKRAEFLLAMGIDKAARGGNKLVIEKDRPGTVIGKLVICRLGLEEYKGEKQGKITKVLPYVEPVDGFEDPGDEGDIPEDVEEEVEAGEEEILEDEVEDAEDDYVPWEREALKAEGKEKVKEVAASFNVAIVKGMTLSDVLDAIMEAQDAYMESLNGEEDEGSETDPEDEPF